jgi:hypothetical protein
MKKKLHGIDTSFKQLSLIYQSINDTEKKFYDIDISF